MDWNFRARSMLGLASSCADVWNDVENDWFTEKKGWKHALALGLGATDARREAELGVTK